MIWFLAAIKAIEWLCDEPMRILYIIGGYLLFGFICVLIPRFGIACGASIIGGPITKFALETIQHDYGKFLFLGEITWAKGFIIFILCTWLILELFYLPNTIRTIRMYRNRKKNSQPTNAVSPGFVPDNRNPDYNYSFSYGYKIPIGFHNTPGMKKNKKTRKVN